MSDGGADDVVARAEHALADVGRDPRAALAEADAVVASIPRPRAPEQVRAVVTAHRAAGLALRELSELETAEARMRRAVRIADRHARPELGAEARMTLAYVVMERGRMRQAMALTTRALQSADARTTYRLRTIRAMTLQRSGRGDEALAEYAVALPAIRREHDAVWESRLLNNRAIVLATRGDTARAVADFVNAREIYLSDGLTADAAAVLYNLGYLYGIAGDVPRALENLDAAAAESDGLDRPEYWAGRAEILTRAGLSGEAASDSRVAIGLLARRGWRTLEAQAWVGLAAAQLAGRDPDLAAASDSADRARRLLRGQDRPEWNALADYVAVIAGMRQPEGAPTALIDRVAASLDRVGLGLHADDLRVEAALQVQEQSPATALRLLAPMLARPGGADRWERRSSVALAHSMRAEAEGDRVSAARLLRRAWTIADEAQAALGSTDLRAGSADRSRHLVELGIRRSLAEGRPGDTFDWVERGRCAVLRHPPARPASDAAVADALTRWRWAVGAELSRALEGAPSRDVAREARTAEREVTRLARHRREVRGDSRPATVRRVQTDLGSGTFIQYFVWRGDIWATTVTRTTCRQTVVCSAEEASALIRSTSFMLRRVMSGTAAEGHERHGRELSRLLDALDALLLAPLAAGPPGDVVTICPPAALAGVPWALLPSADGAVVGVTPSATTWTRAKARHLPESPRLVAAAGPGLPSATAECLAAVQTHQEGRVLLGAEATAAAVAVAAREADILHVAAHGRLRRDNPLFSSLALADGPLSGYDIDSWTSAPATVVLSACSAAAEAPVVGDELLGLAAIVLGAGARTVVAAPLPVPDERTAEVMIRLHEELAQGLAPATALRRCQRSFDDGDPVTRVVAGSFLALGA